MAFRRPYLKLHFLHVSRVDPERRQQYIVTIISGVGAVLQLFLLHSILFADFVFDAENVHGLVALEEDCVDRPLRSNRQIVGSLVRYQVQLEVGAEALRLKLLDRHVMLAATSLSRG